MFRVMVYASPVFLCQIEGDEEQKVLTYLEDHPDLIEEYGEEGAKVMAVRRLFNNDELDLYKDTEVVDFLSENIVPPKASHDPLSPEYNPSIEFRTRPLPKMVKAKIDIF